MISPPPPLLIRNLICSGVVFFLFFSFLQYGSTGLQPDKSSSFFFLFNHWSYFPKTNKNQVQYFPAVWKAWHGTGSRGLKNSNASALSPAFTWPQSRCHAGKLMLTVFSWQTFSKELGILFPYSSQSQLISASIWIAWCSFVPAWWTLKRQIKTFESFV